MNEVVFIPLIGKYGEGLTTKVSASFAYLAVEGPWVVSTNGYALRRWKGKYQKLHHAVLPGQKGMQIDHINGDKFDNRIENLRLVSPSQNQRNRGAQKNSQLGVKNVSFYKRDETFRVQFTIEGKDMWIGDYKTLEEAIAKRDEAKRAYDY